MSRRIFIGRTALLAIAGLGIAACSPRTRTPPVAVDERSIFSVLIDQNGGRIPYPFEKLLNDLYAKESTDPTERIETVLVPKGRSLHRDKADFASPRVLASMGQQFPIFFGYAPANEQLEVISFNPAKAQFDFQVVTDYRDGGVPKLSTPARELCVQCHQHGGPIFPRSPWREMRERKPGTEEAFFKKYGYTNDIPSHDKDENLVAKAIRAAMKGKTSYQGLDLQAYESETKGFHGHFTRGPAASYAFSLRLHNWSWQMHRVAKDACEGDLDCRAIVLKDALLFPSLKYKILTLGIDTVRPIFDQHVKELTEAVRRHWPSDGFSYPSPVVPDRKVLGRNDDSPLGYVVRPLLPDGVDVTYYEMLGDYVPHEFYYLADTNLVDLQGIPWKSFHEEEVTDAKVLDPKTPRPAVHRIASEKAGEFLLTNGLEGLNFSQADENVLRSLDYVSLRKLLAKEASKYRPFVEQWPPDTRRVMAMVLADMNRPKDAESYLAAARQANPLATSAVGSARAANYATSPNPFIRYCAGCHLSETGADDLPLTSNEKLSKIPEVCEVLRKSTMPPARGAWQPSEKERAAMLALLNCAAK